ncbi:phosphoglycerate dehydrogenase [Oscillibacter sp.]|uniref:phosphoglycerate dehydrogenase n=1 Tax=Oscillibacter sp. TaxID=1945593 RepID=UPI0028A04423|nr:phosphoglycerate dehydrogenase [Oscillibacter sp.]
MSKRVLVTSRSFGSIDSTPKDILEQAGCEVILMGKDFDMERFAGTVTECDALIIGAHDFPVELMDCCGKLKVICKHGAGLDNLHLEEAKARGIAVCNVPGTNANAVADLTLGLMLSCARHISLGDRRVRQGQWKALTGKDVYAKTLGLLGFGAVARNVARRAVGFSMRVLAYDPYVHTLPEGFEHVTLCESAAEVISGCEFLSIHLPLNEETRGMIGAAELAAMRPGAYVINTARGGIVDEKALYEALVSGHLSGAAMDVTEVEPMDTANPLLTLDNVVVTPHIGMYSREAIGAVSVICAENVAACLRGGELKFRVV